MGRQIETTLSHPFLTVEGWKPLGELRAGDRVAVPRALPVFGTDEWPECRVKLLAYLEGEGKGLFVAQGTFDLSRPGVASQALGIAQGAFDEMLGYTRIRRQFGQSVLSFEM